MQATKVPGPLFPVIVSRRKSICPHIWLQNMYSFTSENGGVLCGTISNSHNEKFVNFCSPYKIELLASPGFAYTCYFTLEDKNNLSPSRIGRIGRHVPTLVQSASSDGFVKFTLEAKRCYVFKANWNCAQTREFCIRATIGRLSEDGRASVMVYLRILSGRTSYFAPTSVPLTPSH